MYPPTSALATTIAAERRREATTARLIRSIAREQGPVHRRSPRPHLGLTTASNALGMSWLTNALAAITDNDDHRRSEHARP
jgi:hypothetical protein